jgi:hypothetical protein
MKKLLLLVPLLLALGGCATFNADLARLQAAFTVVTTSTVPASTAQVAVSSFEVLEASATEYFIYCKKNPTTAVCAPGTVANPGPLRIAIKYDRQGRKARDEIKAAGRSGALISTTAYNLLVDAVTNLTTPVANLGVPQ